jgi:hypothetical protein
MIVVNGKVEEHVLWSSNAASIVMCKCADVMLGVGKRTFRKSELQITCKR